MPRNYKKKGIQTCPELAGRQNMKDVVTGNDQSRLGDANVQLFERAMKVKGTNWTEDEMSAECLQYFRWCAETESKPNKAGLALWLGATKSTLWAWLNEPNKYGAISNVIAHSCALMENGYIGRIEKYPTGNVFLLKTSHGHVETSKLDVSDSRGEETNAQNVLERVAKLGLDK